MDQRDGMKPLNAGGNTGRIPFMPTIFEHSAFLLGRTPGEVAQSEDLIAKAQIKAYELYGHDAVTVGIDVYNIEAEALGCKVRYHSDCSIPGVLTHPFPDGFDEKDAQFSTRKGRLVTILNAAEKVNRAIGRSTSVGIGICGPFSIAVELAGYENIIADCMCDGGKAHVMLDAALKFQIKYCDEIMDRGIGITIFESWATPPLVSPDIYREFVMPYEKLLISHIKSKNAASVPLVIGGDTSLIADYIIETGTTLLVADYKVDIAAYMQKAAAGNLSLRGNIDPKLVQRGPVDEIMRSAEDIISKAGDYPKFILGTGVIPYDTPPENILAIKRYLEEKR